MNAKIDAARHLVALYDERVRLTHVMARCRMIRHRLAWLAFTILPTTATTYLVLGWVRAW